MTKLIRLDDVERILNESEHRVEASKVTPGWWLVDRGYEDRHRLVVWLVEIPPRDPQNSVANMMAIGCRYLRPLDLEELAKETP